MSASAALPTPPSAEADTMLSRKLGQETANYFSSSPLNRLSFLRADPTFLGAALRHASSRFLLLDRLAPLVLSPEEMAWATFADVAGAGVVPADTFDRPESEVVRAFDSAAPRPLVVFLGLEETAAATTAAATTTEKGGNGPEKGGDVVEYRAYRGRPYFAVDVTPKGPLAEKASALVKEMEAKGLYFYRTRVPNSFPPAVAAIYAQARQLVDWNTRNTFCGSCGSRTLSIHAGSKRVCPPTDAAHPGHQQPECPTRTSVSNLCFPRTDPTVITTVLSADGHRVLLGRQARWAPGFYSALAGFVEPAESIEDAVRREVWEEAGVPVARVAIHSSQPWPFPAGLMVGAVGQVGPSSSPSPGSTGPDADPIIDLGHDAELEDARWFPIEEVARALRVWADVPLGGQPPVAAAEQGPGASSLRVPPRTAIAHQLMAAVVNGDYASGVEEGGEEATPKM